MILSSKLPQRLFLLRKRLYSHEGCTGIYRIGKGSNFNHRKERLEEQGLIIVHIPGFIHQASGNETELNAKC